MKREVTMKEKEKKQNEVNPNYRVGNKNEILLLLHKLGGIPSHSIRWLTSPDSKRILMRSIKQMEEDGIIVIKKKGTENIILLNNLDGQRKKYEKHIPDELINYYFEFSKDNVKKISERDIASLTKTIKDIDAQLFFHSCGVNVGPDSKDITSEFIDKNENSYYNSRELKRMDFYKVPSKKNPVRNTIQRG